MKANAPDPQSMALADTTNTRHPRLNVQSCPMVINDEIASLRRCEFRGICLVGVGSDGWLPHWHQPTDAIAQFDPEDIATAAQFALAMMQKLDRQA